MDCAVLVRSVCSSIASARRTNLLMHRMAVIKSAYEQEGVSDNFLAPKDKLNTRLFGLCEVKSNSAISALQQTAPFFGTFIHNSPSILLKALLTRMKKPDYQAIIKVAIPEVYGYFSSAEMVDNAFLFYQMVGKEVEPRLAVEILEPFFVCLVTRTFTETAFAQFLNQCDHNASVFLGCLQDALWCLPASHLLIMKALMQRSLKSSTELFFNRMVRRAWEDFAPTDCDALRDVFQNSTSLVGEEFWNALYFTESRYKTPHMYYHGNKRFLDVLLCVNNIQLLANMYSEAECLPRSLSRRELCSSPKEVRFSHFWASLFPDQQNVYELPCDALLPADEPSIEQLIKLRLFLQMTTEACDVSKCHLVHCMAQPIQHLVSSQKSMRFFESASAHFTVTVLKQVFYLALVEKVLHGNTLTNTIEHLSLPFFNLLKSNLPDQHPNITRLIQHFKCPVRLPHAFFMLMHLATVLQHSSQHVIQLLAEGHIKNFLPTYLVLKCCAFSKPTFVRLCTQDQLDLWQCLDAFIDKLLSTDIMISDALAIMSLNLADEFDQLCRC